jgi:hypothetical protein
LARTITNLILLLYGIWTLYCVYQFTHGDSWAAKALAGVTFGIFTAILGFFTFRIWQLAHKYKELEGDASALFEDKETWVKYSLSTTPTRKATGGSSCQQLFTCLPKAAYSLLETVMVLPRRQVN